MIDQLMAQQTSRGRPVLMMLDCLSSKEPSLLRGGPASRGHVGVLLARREAKCSASSMRMSDWHQIL